MDDTNGNYQVTGPIAIKNHLSLIGDKRYELSNHLGNVLVVVSDKKVPNLDSGTLLNFNADVLSYTDYFPFGMLVPNRMEAQIHIVTGLMEWKWIMKSRV